MKKDTHTELSENLTDLPATTKTDYAWKRSLPPRDGKLFLAICCEGDAYLLRWCDAFQLYAEDGYYDLSVNSKLFGLDDSISVDPYVWTEITKPASI